MKKKNELSETKYKEWLQKFIRLAILDVPYYSIVKFSPEEIRNWFDDELTPLQAFNHWWAGQMNYRKKK